MNLSEGIHHEGAPCTVLATFQQIGNFSKVKLLKPKTRAQNVGAEVFPPSAAGVWGGRDPQVLSALKEVSDRSEQALWMEEWTDIQTRALTASLSCWTNHPWNLCLQVIWLYLPRSHHEGPWAGLSFIIKIPMSKHGVTSPMGTRQGSIMGDILWGLCLQVMSPHFSQFLSSPLDFRAI